MKKQVQLGQNGMRVYPVGLGCMGFSHASGAPTDHDTAVRTIRQAYEMGYDFFDTAECYTGVYPDGTVSYNEELVGEALKDVRDRVVIATKCGVTHGGDHLILDSSPARIRSSVEGSLKKLGTDHIDVYYQHRIDPKVEPEAVAETMGDLIREGKILSWGISETTEEYLRRAHAVTPVTAIENRYSMMARMLSRLDRSISKGTTSKPASFMVFAMAAAFSIFLSPRTIFLPKPVRRAMAMLICPAPITSITSVFTLHPRFRALSESCGLISRCARRTHQIPCRPAGCQYRKFPQV